MMFASGTIPMVAKAWRTKDLRSYSLAQLASANVGNLIHWLYIAALPFGPISFLHGFYTITTLAMLVWYVQHRRTWAAPAHHTQPTPLATNS